MRKNLNRFFEHIRLAWAIAAKDIVDGIKNKVILTIILTIAFMLILYKLLPIVTMQSDTPLVAIYDGGNSTLVALLENSPNVSARAFSSRASMLSNLATEGVPALGLAIPANLDSQLRAGQAVALDGYVQHWVSPAATAALQTQVEREIAALVGQPVPIQLGTDYRTYPHLDRTGPHSWAGLSMVAVLAFIGLQLLPQLMIEERRAKTLDVLLISPAAAGHVIAGKAVAGLVYCLAAIALLLALNIAMVARWDVAIMSSFSGATLAVALGICMGGAIQDKQKLAVWAMVGMLVCMLPVVLAIMAQDLPEQFNAAVRWFPTVAVYRLFVVSMSDSATLAECGADLAVIGGSAALLFGLAIGQIRRADR